jgi:hypothetical protein
MIPQEIPDNIQRFILRSIDSVSHLEATLLMRYDPAKHWDAKSMAQGLYISEKKAGDVLSDLCSAGFAEKEDADGTSYYYHPTSSELADAINQLSEIYSRNLIEVTNLIHSKTGRQAQQFGDAFKWQNDKDSIA